MGEVWHAYYLRLRVEVALKALPHDLAGDERRRELLRGEVRSAREVISPNVCRIYDLVEVDGQQLVSMEYIERPGSCWCRLPQWRWPRTGSGASA
jgi:serine/threonine protein kinase